MAVGNNRALRTAHRPAPAREEARRAVLWTVAGAGAADQVVWGTCRTCHASATVRVHVGDGGIVDIGMVGSLHFLGTAVGRSVQRARGQLNRVA
jgi:hypothetical protein